MGEARALVTGVGVVSPLGLGRKPFWEALTAGRSAIGEIRRFDPGPRPPRLAAEVADFATRELLPPALVRRMDRLSQMIGVAAVMAVADAGFPRGAESADELAVVVGSALGNMSESAQFLDRLFSKGPALANPMLFPNLVLNAPASQVSMALGWRGPNLTVSAGELSGEAALEAGLALLRRRRARAVVVAAGDEASEVVFRGLKDFGYLCPRRGRDERSRPFDASADGPVMGEGATALLLESEEEAAQRGARVYATLGAVRRFELDCRSPHLWPSPGRALDLPPADLVFSGADSSPERDRLELSLLPGRTPEETAVFSLAGAVGTHGSLGLTNVATAALCLCSGILPPIAGLEQPRKEYPFAFSRERREAAWEKTLVLGTARGGAAVTLELGRAGGA